MARWAGQRQAIDESCPHGLRLSVVHAALEDFSVSFTGVVRLTRNKCRGHRLHREEELVPLISWVLRNLLGLEMVGRSG